MIFVVLGTWSMPFIRPLIEIEDLVKRRVIQEEVVVQCGHTKFESTYLTCVPFFSSIEIEQKYVDARMIICQAGIGSIMLGLRHEKKVISIARSKAYNEHIDDHQTEILDVFSKQQFILKWSPHVALEDLLCKAESFSPVKYNFCEEQISARIVEYIESVF